MCLSVCPSLHSHTTAQTWMQLGGMIRGFPQFVHCWADLQLVHGFCCYDNIAPNAKCQQCLYSLYGWLSCVVRRSFFSTTPNDAVRKNICEMSYFCVKIKILTEAVSHLHAFKNRRKCSMEMSWVTPLRRTNPSVLVIISKGMQALKLRMTESSSS